jgi:predicted double-glycine peptidase
MEDSVRLHHQYLEMPVNHTPIFEIGVEPPDLDGAPLPLVERDQLVHQALGVHSAKRVAARPASNGAGGAIPKILFVLVLALAWAGLAPSLAVGLDPVRSLLELRRDKVVVQDYDISCGAAALATLLTYQHGDPVAEREVAEGLIRREEYLENPELVRIRQGFSLLDLKRFVEGRGYRGRGLGNVALDDLRDLAPAIVPVRFKGYDHFVVFRGERDGRVLLADPAWGNRTMPVERFAAAWLHSPEFGKVAFVVERRDGREPPNRLAPRPDDFIM